MQADALQLARVAANDQERLTDIARQFLVALAALYLVKGEPPLRRVARGLLIVATLDSAGFPVRTSITYNGHTYTGEFDDFLTDRGENLVYSPHLIKFAMDGMVFADLEVNWHQTNPYVIFPVPSQVASK